MITGFKRKRLGKTDYRKRLKLLLSEKPRLVVRKSLKNIRAQVAIFDEKGDKIVCQANSSELKKFGYNGSRGNLPAAYLVGILVGSKAKKVKVDELILDSGLYTSVKGSRVYSVLKGCLDSGVSVPCSEEILPTEDRLKGKHIKGFNESNFESVKKKILEE